jgi:hypothetical protein
MVRIVEEHARGRVRSPPGADARDDLRRVPLVDEHHAHAVQRVVEVLVVQLLRRVGGDRDRRIVAGEARQRLNAVIGNQVRGAPAAGWLEGAHLVASADQLADNATQKVGIAVVPVRSQGMAEQREPHGQAAVWSERSL